MEHTRTHQPVCRLKKASIWTDAWAATLEVACQRIACCPLPWLYAYAQAEANRQKWQEAERRVVEQQVSIVF